MGEGYEEKREPPRKRRPQTVKHITSLTGPNWLLLLHMLFKQSFKKATCTNNLIICKQKRPLLSIKTHYAKIHLSHLLYLLQNFEDKLQKNACYFFLYVTHANKNFQFYSFSLRNLIEQWHFLYIQKESVIIWVYKRGGSKVVSFK